MDGMRDQNRNAHANDNGMGGMGVMTPPPPTQQPTVSSTTPQHKMTTTMMHMSFYWSHEAEILFSAWPGSSKGMYVLALFVFFTLAFVVEWLSRSTLVGEGVDHNGFVSRVLRTLVHVLRVGLAYVVMLAVMSYNCGVFVAVVAGHGIGFLFFGSRV